MSRCIVNVATGEYVRGQQRLLSSEHVRRYSSLMYADTMPPGSPSHRDVPYAFKAWAIKAAMEQGARLVLWADASIIPIRSIDPLWEKIERDGYWISRNGFFNSEWTAERAYADLAISREENEAIEHVVATTFGLNLDHGAGRYIFDEYLRLAQTDAFKGPWSGGVGVQHRHDQTALSVVAWRAGCQLTSPPEWFAYRGGEIESTILVADGSFR